MMSFAISGLPGSHCMLHVENDAGCGQIVYERSRWVDNVNKECSGDPGQVAKLDSWPDGGDPGQHEGQCDL